MGMKASFSQMNEIQREWQWTYADTETSVRKKISVCSLSANDVVQFVENNRAVFKKEGLYYKFYFRKPSSFMKRMRSYFCLQAQNEYDNLLFLRKNSIPTIRPVAWGKCGLSSVLVTEEVPDTMPILDIVCSYIRKNEHIPLEFLCQWAAFVKKILDLRIYHYDFHAGNILYDSANKNLLLIDPCWLKKPLFLRRTQFFKMLINQFFLLHKYYCKEELMPIFAILAPHAPEQLYKDMMDFLPHYIMRVSLPEALKIFHKEQKEEKGGVLRKTLPYEGCYSLDHTLRKKFSKETAQKIWENDFIYSLYPLPLLNTVGLEPDSGFIHQQMPGEMPCDKKVIEELSVRLHLFGLDPEKFDFCTNYQGRTVLVDKLTLTP